MQHLTYKSHEYETAYTPHIVFWDGMNWSSISIYPSREIGCVLSFCLRYYHIQTSREHKQRFLFNKPVNFMGGGSKHPWDLHCSNGYLSNISWIVLINFMIFWLISIYRTCLWFRKGKEEVMWVKNIRTQCLPHPLSLLLSLFYLFLSPSLYLSISPDSNF